MGKLHTLRRAIERNPQQWLTAWLDGKQCAWQVRPGHFFIEDKGHWHPGVHYSDKWYRAFIKVTLQRLGLLK